MWKCRLCENGPDGSHWHSACRAEMESRMDSGRCVFCNSPATVLHRCVTCVTETNPQFAGYPGGA